MKNYIKQNWKFFIGAGLVAIVCTILVATKDIPYMPVQYVKAPVCKTVPYQHVVGRSIATSEREVCQ